MLLDSLTIEEKKAFWNIANVLSAADGRVDEEVSILKQYSEEMGVEFSFVDPASVDVAAELNSIKGGDIKDRKIIYFELFGVAYADTDFSEKEIAILDQTASALEIADDVRAALEDCVKGIFDSYRKLGDILA